MSRQVRFIRQERRKDANLHDCNGIHYVRESLSRWID